MKIVTNRTSLEVSLCRMGFPSTLQHDGSAWRRLSPQEVPPAGPVDAGQVALAGIIGSAQTGGLPSTQTQYLMHPFWMLYVQEEKKL